MDKEKILNNMSRYDFNAPINVTMVFDDCEENDIIEEQYVINRNKQKQNIVMKEEIQVKTEPKLERNEKVESTYTVIQDNSKSNKLKNGKARKRKYDKISSNDSELSNSIRTVQCNINNNDLTGSKKVVKRKKAARKSEQNPDNGQEDRDAQNLRILSDNIIMVMECYYQMQKHKKNNSEFETTKKTVEAFHYVRNWTLNKSFNILETTILPREDDAVFLEMFLDSIVKKAYSQKSVNCNRWHVKPFLTDMIQYAKIRSNYYKRQNLQNTSNPLLKTFLDKPPVPLNLHHSSNPPKNNGQIMNAYNSRCIFSTGPPGREISLSLLPPSDVSNKVLTDNLPSHNFRSPPNMQVLHGNNYAPINHSTNVYNNLEPLAYQQPCSQVLNTHSVSKRPLPPQYSIVAGSHTDFSNSSYNQQNFSQTIINSPPPAPHSQLDTTRSSVSTESGYVSPSHSSPCYDPVDGPNTEQFSRTTPSITNVFSLNPGCSNIMTGLCQLCGKHTSGKCRICHKYYYCSYICEQLDATLHQTVCRPTYQIQKPSRVGKA